MKCKTCSSKPYCDEQHELSCKQDGYCWYSPTAWANLTEFIDEFNEHCYMGNESDKAFFDIWELEMAKAFVRDYPEGAVRVSKIILALKDVNEVKIKIE